MGPFKLTDYEKVYATDPNADIFELRGLDRSGVVVVVRPDQYVANVLPLTATAELAAFFAPLLQPRRPRQCDRRARGQTRVGSGAQVPGEVVLNPLPGFRGRFRIRTYAHDPEERPQRPRSGLHIVEEGVPGVREFLDVAVHAQAVEYGLELRCPATQGAVPAAEVGHDRAGAGEGLRRGSSGAGRN